MFRLLCVQVVLQALVAEVQATEEFLIPPQLHAGVPSHPGIITQGHLTSARLLISSATCTSSCWAHPSIVVKAWRHGVQSLRCWIQKAGALCHTVRLDCPHALHSHVCKSRWMFMHISSLHPSPCRCHAAASAVRALFTLKPRGAHNWSYQGSRPAALDFCGCTCLCQIRFDIG
jgi:hypothetical protein